eukprot:4447461-Alexandrium_andersonii.AAC.1
MTEHERVVVHAALHARTVLPAPEHPLHLYAVPPQHRPRSLLESPADTRSIASSLQRHTPHVARIPFCTCLSRRHAQMPPCCLFLSCVSVGAGDG